MSAAQLTGHFMSGTDNLLHVKSQPTSARHLHYLTIMKKQNQIKMKRSETKQQRIDEEIRREHLEEAIENEYENTTIDSVEALAARYEDSMVEMFQVVKKKKYNLTLEHFFQEGEYYHPVRASQNLAQYINVGDVFLLTMAWDGEAWDILLMSSPYETMSL